MGERALPPGAACPRRLRTDPARPGPLGQRARRALTAADVQHCLVEGGPTLAAALLDAGLIDEIVWFVAPVLFGAGPIALPAAGARSTSVAVRRVEMMGDDVLVEGDLRACSPGSLRNAVGSSDVEQLDDAVRLSIGGSVVLSDVHHGDSIAVNGVCLTVVDLAPDHVHGQRHGRDPAAQLAVRRLARHRRVNLERAARLDSRIGGHLVQGHIDGTGTVPPSSTSENWTVMRFSLPDGLARYVVEKGSITVDGVSLTVVSVDDGGFSVSLIPTTLVETTLGERRVGDLVNIEVDAIAKYVERLIQWRQS